MKEKIKGCFYSILELLSTLIFVYLPLTGGICGYLIGKQLINAECTLLVVCYLFWIWILDTGPEQGGRCSKWIRSWKIWKCAHGYFPIKLDCVPGFEMDPTKNYLFCCHPHGIMPYGVIFSFICDKPNHLKLVNHLYHIITIKFNFIVPIYREVLLALGLCWPSAKSINYILSKPTGGNVVLLFPGGAEESYESKADVYHLVLKNRKGFIKVALRNGNPIVPVFSFGEVNTFSQVRFPESSLLRNIQNCIKYVTGVAPIIYYGRAFLSIPYRTPINIVVGKPLHIQKVQNPTQEEINVLHGKYIQMIVDLFEEQKYNYLKNPDDTKLIIM